MTEPCVLPSESEHDPFLDLFQGFHFFDSYHGLPIFIRCPSVILIPFGLFFGNSFSWCGAYCFPSPLICICILHLSVLLVVPKSLVMSSPSLHISISPLHFYYCDSPESQNVGFIVILWPLSLSNRISSRLVHWRFRSLYKRSWVVKDSSVLYRL